MKSYYSGFNAYCGASPVQDYVRAASKLFCSAFEKAHLIEPTRENIAAWLKYTRMTPEDIELSIYDSYALAKTFRTIGNILKAEFLPKDYKFGAIELEETEAAS